MKKLFTGSLAFIFLVAVFSFRGHIKETVQDILKPPLPEAKSVKDFSPASTLKIKKSLPSEVNLKIPFSQQAPFSNWGLPFKEACEEASLIMAHRFLTGEPLDEKIMREEILKLVEWEKKEFGYFEDTTAEEMAKTLRKYFKHRKVEVRTEFTIDDIKREVAAGHPVILPVAGRLLGNPNFRQPGPIYHVLVVKGYTKTHIITNDPGTRKGADFLYTPEVIMNAIHDWNAQDILKGKKVMVALTD